MIDPTRYAMSKYATKADRDAAINDAIDRLAKKRDHAADVEGKQMVAWSYQVEIDELVALLSGQR